MLKLWQSIKVFIKGMIMGAVNVFPISSGTISLVLGVYERFINAINSLRIKNFKLLFKGEVREFARQTDMKFLLTIVVGVVAGMVLTALFLKPRGRFSSASSSLRLSMWPSVSRR